MPVNVISCSLGGGGDERTRSRRSSAARSISAPSRARGSPLSSIAVTYPKWKNRENSGGRSKTSWPADPVAAAEVKPVWRLMRDELLRSTKLFVDETTAPVLDPGRGRTEKGYF